jgi:hypothetical protein
MASKVAFLKTLKPEMRFFDQRFIAGRASTTLILPLTPKGEQTTQYDPIARLGVYAWNTDHWEFKGDYGSRREARSAAARLRKISN